MKIFISWSGERSKAFASALHGWLKPVIQSLEPWISQHDIMSGQRWLPEINENLKDCHFGILCLTPENLSSSWLLFEAGAIGKSIGEARVMPLLLDLKPADVPPPLGQFQAQIADKAGIEQLVTDINKELKNPLEAVILKSSFNGLWPALNEKIEAARKIKSEADSTGRSDSEILEELLNTVRRVERRINTVALHGAIRPDARAHPGLIKALNRASDHIGRRSIRFLMPHVEVIYPDLYNLCRAYLAADSDGQITIGKSIRNICKSTVEELESRGEFDIRIGDIISSARDLAS